MEDELKELKTRLLWAAMGYFALALLYLMLNYEVNQIKRKLYGVVAREETNRRNIEVVFRRLDPPKKEPEFVEVEVPPVT